MSEIRYITKLFLSCITSDYISDYKYIHKILVYEILISFKKFRYRRSVCHNFSHYIMWLYVFVCLKFVYTNIEIKVQLSRSNFMLLNLMLWWNVDLDTYLMWESKLVMFGIDSAYLNEHAIEATHNFTS